MGGWERTSPHMHWPAGMGWRAGFSDQSYGQRSLSLGVAGWRCREAESPPHPKSLEGQSRGRNGAEAEDTRHTDTWGGLPFPPGLTGSGG